ncbi:Uncharacterised protein [uncultured archaeon]|nr:Uncharacterised protein [uncultured archaeon]
MKHYAHTLSSWRRLKKLNPEIYETQKETAFRFSKEIHFWFDEFYGKKTNEFDYSFYPLSHREARHHSEGIEECVFVFTNKYGSEYSEIIQREAAKHIEADMHFIPQKRDYSKKDFWENWSLRYESFFHI